MPSYLRIKKATATESVSQKSADEMNQSLKNTLGQYENYYTPSVEDESDYFEFPLHDSGRNPFRHLATEETKTEALTNLLSTYLTIEPTNDNIAQIKAAIEASAQNRFIALQIFLNNNGIRLNSKSKNFISENNDKLITHPLEKYTLRIHQFPETQFIQILSKSRQPLATIEKRKETLLCTLHETFELEESSSSAVNFKGALNQITKDFESALEYCSKIRNQKSSTAVSNTDSKKENKTDSNTDSKKENKTDSKTDSKTEKDNNEHNHSQTLSIPDEYLGDENSEERKRFEHFVNLCRFFPDSDINITQEFIIAPRGKKRGLHISISAKGRDFEVTNETISVFGRPPICIFRPQSSKADQSRGFLSSALAISLGSYRHKATSEKKKTAAEDVIKFLDQREGCKSKEDIQADLALIKDGWKPLLKGICTNDNDSVEALLSEIDKNKSEKELLLEKLTQIVKTHGTKIAKKRPAKAEAISKLCSGHKLTETDINLLTQQNTKTAKLLQGICNDFYPSRQKAYELKILLLALGYEKKEDNSWSISERPALFNTSEFAEILVESEKTRKMMFIEKLQQELSEYIQQNPGSKENQAIQSLIDFKNLDEFEQGRLNRSSAVREILNTLIKAYFPERNDISEPLYYTLHKLGYVWDECKRSAILEEKISVTKKITVQHKVVKGVKKGVAPQAETSSNTSSQAATMDPEFKDTYKKLYSALSEYFAQRNKEYDISFFGLRISGYDKAQKIAAVDKLKEGKVLTKSDIAILNDGRLKNIIIKAVGASDIELLSGEKITGIFAALAKVGYREKIGAEEFTLSSSQKKILATSDLAKEVQDDTEAARKAAETATKAPEAAAKAPEAEQTDEAKATENTSSKATESSTSEAIPNDAHDADEQTSLLSKDNHGATEQSEAAQQIAQVECSESDDGIELNSPKKGSAKGIAKFGTFSNTSSPETSRETPASSSNNSPKNPG